LSEELSILDGCRLKPIMGIGKFSHRRVKSKKICGHPGGNLSQSGLEVGDGWNKKKLPKGYGLEKVRR